MFTKHKPWRLCLGLSLGLLGSCSATDEPPSGGRIESPAKVNSPLPSSPLSPHPSPATSSSQALHPGPPYPRGQADQWPAAPFPKPSGHTGPWPPRPSEWWGLPFTPMEKIIADICPAQVWSQYVPDADCAKDSECGDGFCDRGHCNMIWTCGFRAGQRCEEHKQCHGLCIEGRCRSCISNEECREKIGDTATICGPPTRPPSHRMCGRTPPRIH